jgi:pSer/pThr/pTyr-binding forkhead associated (FHA) protein
MFGRETSVVLDFARVEKTASVLFVIYAGQRHRVTTHDYLIGRARKTCALVIHDGLISRRHAAVIHRNGTYYMKDLGSTHGIHYKGMRIDNKRIDEGDVFQLGAHELRFTYRKDG